MTISNIDNNFAEEQDIENCKMYHLAVVGELVMGPRHCFGDVHWKELQVDILGHTFRVRRLVFVNKWIWNMNCNPVQSLEDEDKKEARSWNREVHASTEERGKSKNLKYYNLQLYINRYHLYI